MSMFTEQEIKAALQGNRQIPILKLKLDKVAELFRETVQDMAETPGACSCSGDTENRDWCTLCRRGRDGLMHLDELLKL